MRAHVVELLEEGIEASLLRAQIRLWVLANPVFECSVHPFVNAVLLGLSWLDTNWDDSKLDPPARQLREPSERLRAAEWRAVVADHLARDSILVEHRFEAELCRRHMR